MKAGRLIQEYIKQLSTIYEYGEAESMVRIIMTDVAGQPWHDFTPESDFEVAEETKTQLDSAVKRLLNHEPLQYILGEQHFYGLVFKVNPSVLIPRPETEELVDWIIKENSGKKNLRILDIGTGSGCIAISLKKNLPGAEMFATDISEEALKTTGLNAHLLGAAVKLAKADALKCENPFNQTFDIIISNPPYITQAEEAEMNKNVTAFEPHTALFVPDNDPLVFYKAILSFANKHLEQNGTIYFEINEALGIEVLKLLKEYGYTDGYLKKDMQGKDRMVKGTKIQL